MTYPSPRRDKLLRALLGSCATNVPVPAPTAKPLASLYELSKRTGIAYSWVHKNLTQLESKDWIATDGPIEVLDPPAVFAWWQGQRTEPKLHRFHVAQPATAVDALADAAGVPYAITTYFAENAFQGHLFPRRMDLYVRSADLARAKATLVEAGAQLGGTNFRLWTGDDEILEEVVIVAADRGPRVERRYAPVPQVILDLMTEGGSAREAADLLMQRAYPHANASL